MNSMISLDDAQHDDGKRAEYAAQLPPNIVYLFAPDKAYAEQLCQALSDYNQLISCFYDQEILRAALERQMPEALLLDIDSYEGQSMKQEIAQRISPNLPVIYLSKNDHFAQRLAAVREGAEGYFIKPLDVDALSTRIDEKISNNRILAYRVLIVEDDEMLLNYYVAVLNSVGMHVKALIDPAEILDAIKYFKPELILTDLLMPFCNGIEMAKIIRQNNHYVNIPIVFLSSVTETEQQNIALESGADDFLTKPITPENLISAISSRAERYRILNKRR